MTPDKAPDVDVLEILADDDDDVELPADVRRRPRWIVRDRR